jgi:hypothetical protein
MDNKLVVYGHNLMDCVVHDFVDKLVLVHAVDW